MSGARTNATSPTSPSRPNLFTSSVIPRYFVDRDLADRALKDKVRQVPKGPREGKIPKGSREGKIPKGSREGKVRAAPSPLRPDSAAQVLSSKPSSRSFTRTPRSTRELQAPHARVARDVRAARELGEAVLSGGHHLRLRLADEALRARFLHDWSDHLAKLVKVLCGR